MGSDAVNSNLRQYVTNVEHDASGRPTRTQMANGTTRQQSYYSDTGYLETISDALGTSSPFLQRTYSYHQNAKVASVLDGFEPSEQLLSLAYDGLGRLRTGTLGGVAFENQYDALGNLTLKTGTAQLYQHPEKPHAIYSDGDPSAFQYDPSGNLIGRGDRTLDYDARGRLRSVSGAIPAQFGYDHNGQRVKLERGAQISHFLGRDIEIQSVRQPSGQIQWARRVVKTIRVGGLVIARSANGATVSADLEAPGGIRRAELLEVVTVYLAFGSLGIAFCLALGLRSGARVPDAVLASVAALLVYALPVSSALAAASDGDLNANGSIDGGDAVLLLRMIEGQIPPTDRADVAPLNGPADQRVDAADALLMLRALDGDDVDADGLNATAELSAGASPFRHDSDGDGLDDGTEIAQGTDPTNPDSDADGLADGIDPARLNPDADGDGIVDGKDGDPLVSEGQVAHWLHGDQLGSLAVVTNASGAVVRRVHYGIWGEIRGNSLPPGAAAGTPDARGKFTGQHYDDDTGYYYYGARYYDPQIGRFLQPDKISPASFDPQTLNHYAYVLNDPLGYTDPTGNVPQWMSSAWSAISSAGSAVYGFASDAFGALGSAGRWAGSNLGSMLMTGYQSVRSVFPSGETASATLGSGSQGGSQPTTGAYPTSQGGESANDSWLEEAGDYASSMVKGEALEVFGTVVGTPFGILSGFYGIGSGAFNGDPEEMFWGAVDVAAAAVMLRSGSASGWRWGGQALTPDTGTVLNSTSFWHDDRVAKKHYGSAEQFGWIVRAWSGGEGGWGRGGVELGPWGQAYRVYGTVGFGLIGSFQWALGY